MRPSSSTYPHGSAEHSRKARSSQGDITTSDFARSSAAVWTPPCAVTPEHVALESLKSAWNKLSAMEQTWNGHYPKRRVMIVDLHDFEMYRSPHGLKGRSYELLGLHHMEVPKSAKTLLDGILCIGHVEHYVQGIPIGDYSIEGYGDSDESTITTYVQSASAARDPAHDIWYRLNKPTEAYARHHDPFLWVAQLAKHVLDYMDEQPRASVGLTHFRSRFQDWLYSRFPAQSAFDDWIHAIHDKDDFRVCVNAYIEFLYQQAYNLPNSKDLLAHPLWADCMAGGLRQVPVQGQIVKNRTIQDTLATPDVHDCFKHMYFGGVIHSRPLSTDVKARQQRRMEEMGFQRVTEARETTPKRHAYTRFPVHVGDVVAFDPGKADKECWRNADCEWLLYVTHIQLLKNGIQRLFGLYLYRPRETNIFIAQYRYKNELFFSDNCNCKEGALLSTEIKGRYNIQWRPKTLPTDTYFVRQTYVTGESSFVTFVEKHKICECNRGPSSKAESFSRGDTVYILDTTGRKTVLEPVIIQQGDEASANFTVRRFARLNRCDLAEHVNRLRESSYDIAINELILTDEYEEVVATRIQRRCSIRFIPKTEVLLNRIPFPYNRKGAGDFWFFSMGLSTKDGRLTMSFLAADYVKQGSLPQAFEKKLIGLSLFSGGGNLDRGIEEHGAVDVQTVVEWDAAAIHTQRANAQNAMTQQLFCGSVDEHLKMAIDGRASLLVPRIGEVNIAIAGSPCPGFSTLQKNHTSAKSIKNASYVTTICSYVDVYRPEYALLENVIGMAYTRKGLENQNVLSQIVAFFVSLGYQVNQYIMDAWSYGSCQQRSRIILTVAAPGLNPIRQMEHTHSLPMKDTAARSIGMLPNGERFGGREYYPTPFSHVSASTATSDLPDIGNGNVQTCISHPNHCVSAQPSQEARALLELIPRSPPGLGYRDAYDMDLIPPHLEKCGRESGKAYSRIRGAHLIPTITTGLRIEDSQNGATVHWQQNRPITILEARRAQGYLDHEPIIGNLSAQYRIVGNGVDRHVGFALGQAIRQAMVANMRQNIAIGAERVSILTNIEDEDDHFTDVASISSRRSVASQVNTLPKSVKQRRGKPVPTIDSNASGMRDAPPAAPSSCAAATILSRVSSIFTTGIKGMVYRSRRGSSTAPTSPVFKPLKRNYDQFSNGSTDLSAYPIGRPSVDVSVRRHFKIDNTASTTQDQSADRKARKISKSRTAFSRTRYTRHSGLEIVFTPKQWNRKPEREHIGSNL